MNSLKSASFFGLLCAFFTLALPGKTIAQDIKINEILAANSNVITDNFGESDDWVELYNPTAFPVNIGGMYLTDDLANLTKWYIPSNQPQLTTIPEFGFLLIWCDDQTLQGPTHAAFKLSSSGESFALVAGNGSTIIDSYTFGAQNTNISVGRQQDGLSPWVLFANPSPNASNGTGVLFANMPLASQNGGHYNSSFTVSLTTSTPNATIYYTTNGSEPTTNDAQYTSPVLIDETIVLRARAFASNTVPSRTMTHTYLFNIEHDFPIFCLATDSLHFWDTLEGIYVNFLADIEQPIHVELYEADGSFGFRQDMGVQIHGRHSQTYPHKGLSFRARNQYGSDKINYPLFPDMPFDEYGSFILRASGNDWKRMMCRDAMASSLIRDMADVDSLIKDPDLQMQGYRPTVVYLNGEYFGIHNLREKLDYRYLTTHYGIPEDAADIVANEANLEHGNLDAWEAHQSFIEGADFTNSADLTELQNDIDISHFFDYFLFHIYADNNDWPGNNNRRWRLRQPGEKWRYFVYDLDSSFGLNPLSLDYNSGDWTSLSVEMVMSDTATQPHNEPYSTLLLRKLMQNDTLRANFINRMADQLNILYKPERVLGRIDEFEALYENEIPQHSDLWWNGETNWEDDMDVARLFATNRTPEMFSQFKNYFTDDIDNVVDLTLKALPAAGGEIHLNTMNLHEAQYPWTGTHFSGIDVPLHTVPNPGYIFTGWTPAALGTNPVTTMHLNGNGNITANFVLGSTQIGNIVINEINYNSPLACDAGDWIELYNAGTTSVDLSAWFLEDGSGNYFNIPANTHLEAGGYLILAQDVAKFASVHPQVANVIGGFGASLTGGFGLNNAGEWIAIHNANRSFQDTVHYLDLAPWPTAADGNGPSLELKNPSLDNALAIHWFADANSKGSPGEQNRGILNLGADIISCEALVTYTLNAAFDCVGCTYLWNNGSTQPLLQVSPPVGNHTYSVTVTDTEGITQTDQLIIQIIAPIIPNANVQAITCYGASNGSISLQATGGSGTLTYLWATGQTGSSINALAPGAYSVTITDSNNCQNSAQFNLSEPPPITQSISVVPVACFADANGNISVTANGGTGTLTYQWNNGVSGNTINNAIAGTYILTITDSNNCQSTESVLLSNPAPISFGMSANPVNCFGGSDGSISVTASGGTGTLTYQWSNGATGNVLNNLPEGNYTLTITDANNCQSNGAFYLAQPEPIVVDFAIGAVTCFGAADGTISLTASGGTGTLSYLWNTGATGTTLVNLSPDMYLVTITDDNNCEQIEQIVLPEASPFSTNVDITPISCAAAADGAIAVEVTGGSGVYDYSWNTGATGNSISNLPAGTYTITIMDSNNCGHLELIELTEPAAITYEVAIASVSCFGSTDASISVTASGGTGALTYLWDNGATGNTISNLPEGIYNMTITDGNNCESSGAFDVPSPPYVTVEVTIDPITCFNAADGSISLSTLGGTGTFTYAWNNGMTGAMIENLPAGTYTATVSDDNACTSITSVLLSEPEQLSASVIATNPTSSSGGSILLMAEGGTWPHYVLWNTGATTFELNDLPGGTYTYTLTDYNGCVVEGTVVLEFVNSLTDPAALDWLIYPNPSSGVVYLESGAGAMTVGVYDVLGRLQRVFSREQAVALWPLDLRGLGAGLYVLKIEVDGVILVRGVVLE